MDWTLFFVFFAACAAAGSTGGLFSPGQWYDNIVKPPWTPPDWLFPLAWTVLYISIAVAAARVAPREGSALAMACWALQISLNGLWSPVFFGLKRLGTAMVVLGCLWVAVAGCLVTFWRLDPVSGALFIPYLVWATYAGALNLWIWRNNHEPEAVVVAQG